MTMGALSLSPPTSKEGLLRFSTEKPTAWLLSGLNTAPRSSATPEAESPPEEAAADRIFRLAPRSSTPVALLRSCQVPQPKEMVFCVRTPPSSL